MKALIIKYTIALTCLLAMSACDKSKLTIIYGHQIYVEFQDSQGNNLIEKYQLKIDTLESYSDHNYELNSEEYTLSLVIDGVEEEADPICYKHINRPFPGLSFTCDLYNEKLTKKKDYVYEYAFVCPKLFGDDKPRMICPKWKYKSKGIYLIDQLLFDGQKALMKQEKVFVIVLDQ